MNYEVIQFIPCLKNNQNLLGVQCVTNCHLELEYEPSPYFNQPTTAQKFSTLEQHVIDQVFVKTDN